MCWHLNRLEQLPKIDGGMGMIHWCQVPLVPHQLLLFLEATMVSTQVSPLSLASRPGAGVDHLEEDLALDREFGEALISDYFSGVVWLHVV